MSRSILKVEDGTIYETMTIAAHENQCDISDLGRAVRDKNEYVGYRWEYVNDEIFGELWKDHPRIPDLKVSNIGRLQFTKGRRSWGSFRTYKYRQLSSGIRRNRKHLTVYHHRAVAETWLNIDPKERIYHIDGDVENNYVYNLRN